MKIVEDDPVYVCFTDAQIEKIVESVGLDKSSQKAKQLIFLTEDVAEHVWREYFFSMHLPKEKEMINIIERLHNDVGRLTETIKHIDDNYGGEFWSVILRNKRGYATEFRLKKYETLVRGLPDAKLFLAHAAGNEKRVSFINTEFGKIYTDSEFMKIKYIKYLSNVYLTVMGKKPGKSKSTIGPFVRFAYNVMCATHRDWAPSIDTVNERWARTKYNAKKINLVRENGIAYAAKKGVEFPF